jgi:hypothetical protein
MNIRERIIRWLGGIPAMQCVELPSEEGTLYIVDHFGVLAQSDSLQGFITLCGGVPLPKAGAGQTVVRPQVRNNPHRHKKLDPKILKAVNAEEMAERFLEIDQEMEETRALAAVTYAYDPEAKPIPIPNLGQEFSLEEGFNQVFPEGVQG